MYLQRPMDDDESHVWLVPDKQDYMFLFLALNRNFLQEPEAIISFVWFYSDDEELSKWIAASTTHWTAWEGLKCLFNALRARNEIPGALREWADDALGGKRQQPKRKRGGDGLRNVLRDRFIVIGVMGLESLLGIPATYNKSEQRSACYLVADAMFMDYEAVRKVWQSSKWDKLKEAYGLFLRTGDKKLLYHAMSLDIFDLR